MTKQNQNNDPASAAASFLRAEPSVQSGYLLQTIRGGTKEFKDSLRVFSSVNSKLQGSVFDLLKTDNTESPLHQILDCHSNIHHSSCIIKNVRALFEYYIHWHNSMERPPRNVIRNFIGNGTNHDTHCYLMAQIYIGPESESILKFNSFSWIIHSHNPVD